MFRHVVFILTLLVMTGLWQSHAQAMTIDVTDVMVSVQAEDAVKARDTAILQAQHQAFGVLVGATPEHITDAQIARLVSGFSVQNEKLGARSYAARFTVRFNSVAVQNFAHMQNLTINPSALQGRAISAAGQLQQQPASVTVNTYEEGAELNAAQAVPKVQENIVVLPVLDIGARRIIWDEPNPWRDVWQQKDHSIQGMPVRVPLGDISDISDIPDTQFLNGGTANIPAVLDRYMASRLYVVVAKNQGAALDPSGGMALSLYRHDGKKLQFIRKTVMRPRPGYLFNDAVPAAIQMIVMAENRRDDDEDMQEETVSAQENDEPASNQLSEPKTLGSVSQPDTQYVPPVALHPAGAPLVVTVPYQSLAQWVGIQKRLRLVPGVKMIVPSQVSPSSAQLKIITSVPAQELAQNMAMQGFELKSLPNGEMALIER